MKRNLLALTAVVLAIAVSSFTVKKTTTFYYIYPGSGSENSFSNYSGTSGAITTDVQDVEDNVGTITLNWLKVIDADATADATSFGNAFNSYDANHNGILSDDVAAEDASKFDLE